MVKSLLTRFMKGSCVVLCRRPVVGWSPRSRQLLGAQVALPLALVAFGRNVLLVAALGDYPALSQLCGVSAQGVGKGASRDTG